MKPILAIMVLLVTCMLVAASAHAGPPLICHQIDIGDAKSIPWGKDTFDKGGSYDVRRVPVDALEILTAEAPILVRMETLRRAAMHVDGHRDVAEALLGRLMARVIDAEATGRPDALAYFDAGYLAGCYHQLSVETSFGSILDQRRADERDASGYTWVARALKLSGDGKNTPTMHLAAALMMFDSRETLQKEHLRAAFAAGVGDKSDAERSVLEWVATINGTTLDSLRAELGSSSSGDRTGQR